MKIISMNSIIMLSRVVCAFTNVLECKKNTSDSKRLYVGSLLMAIVRIEQRNGTGYPSIALYVYIIFSNIEHNLYDVVRCRQPTKRTITKTYNVWFQFGLFLISRHIKFALEYTRRVCVSSSSNNPPSQETTLEYAHMQSTRWYIHAQWRWRTKWTRIG